MQPLLTTEDKLLIDKEFIFLENQIGEFHFLEDVGKYINNQETANQNPLEIHLTFRVDDYISKILLILKNYGRNLYIDQKIENLLNSVIKVYRDNENWGEDASEDVKEIHNNFQNALKYFESYLNQVLGIKPENKGNNFIYRKKEYTAFTCMQKIIVMHLMNEVQKSFFIINRNYFASQSAYIAQIAVFLGENATNIEMNINRVIGHLKEAKNITENNKHQAPVDDLIAVRNWFKQIGDEKLAKKAFDYLPEYEKDKNL